jgi:serine/threonine protein kinase
MNSSQQIEIALFEAALNFRDPALRQAFLTQTCGADAALRARLEDLLAAERRADTFFDGAATARFSLTAERVASRPESSRRAERIAPRTEIPTASGARAGEPGRAEGPGTRIGRYKLLEQIGAGGCGVVFLAEQKEPVRRRVAFKLIRSGMDTQSVIARFELERQALALMDHPNIAHVLDAGATESGRPYFVMELVHGVKITEYCDANQVGLRQRLELFIQVCHAIQHAHQKGIIHRDIKPSNILVSLQDGAAMPKVIDFGIARAVEGPLTDNTLFTACDQFLGTPAYMSPEQAEGGLGLDTRSDIYSLGVLLYELLTSRTPFDTKQLLQSGIYEMLRTLREEEPQPPSALLSGLAPEEAAAIASQHRTEPGRFLSSLRGDLDWIVLKALAKDRDLRYDTVNGLARDLQRYLNDEPVSARPPSRVYLLRKWVRRNQAVFAAGVAVAAALVIGLGLSTWFLFREREARLEQSRLRTAADTARQEAEKARINESRLLQQSKAREIVSQAAFLLAEGKVAEADALLAKTPLTTIEPSPEAANVFRSLGQWNAISGRWKQAADSYALFVEANRRERTLLVSSDAMDWLAAGSALVEGENLDAYQRMREMALAKIIEVKGLSAIEQTLKACLLVRADAETLSRLRPLGALAANSFVGLEIHTGLDAYVAAFRAMSLAMLEYRQGNYVESLQWCLKSQRYPDSNEARAAGVHAIAAMCAHHLGQHEFARSELAQAREFFNVTFQQQQFPRGEGQGLWLDWAIARILEREAAALIESQPKPIAKPR